MPKPVTLSKYPSEYFTLYECVDRRGEHFVRGFPTEKAAKSLRFDLYGFLKACRLEQHPLTRQWKSYTISVHEDPETETFYLHIHPPTHEYLDLLKDSLAETLMTPPPDEEISDAPMHDDMTDALSHMGFKSPNTKE